MLRLFIIIWDKNEAKTEKKWGQKLLVICFNDVNGNDGREKMTMRIPSKRTNMRCGHAQPGLVKLLEKLFEKMMVVNGGRTG